MKKLDIPVILLSIMLLAMSCEQEKEHSVADYSVTKVDQPLSDDDIASCFNALGLRFERFTCVIPNRKHRAKDWEEDL